jgi:enoyl-CoA hydratase/carnithine racemase
LPPVHECRPGSCHGNPCGGSREEFALVFLALLDASLDFDHLPQPSGYTGVMPNVTNIFDRLPVIVENEMAKQSRQVSRYFSHLAPLPLSL